MGLQVINFGYIEVSSYNEYIKLIQVYPFQQECRSLSKNDLSNINEGYRNAIVSFALSSKDAIDVWLTEFATFLCSIESFVSSSVVIENEIDSSISKIDYVFDGEKIIQIISKCE